jgi:hypothetical protein
MSILQGRLNVFVLVEAEFDPKALSLEDFLQTFGMYNDEQEIPQLWFFLLQLKKKYPFDLINIYMKDKIAKMEWRYQ